MAEDRIDCDELGVDDVVLNDVSMFRMERMGNTDFWIRCYRDHKPDVVFRLAVRDGVLTVLHEED